MALSNSLETYIVFHTAGQPLGLPTSSVTEISPMVPLVTLPAMPPFVVGFLDWGNGEAPLPVVRLERLLRLPYPANVPGLYTPIIVLRAESAFGLLVERVEGLVTGSIDTEGTAVARESFNGCVIGLLPRSGDAEAVAILSAERLLLAEERERLDVFQTQIAARRLELDAV